MMTLQEVVGSLLRLEHIGGTLDGLYAIVMNRVLVGSTYSEC